MAPHSSTLAWKIPWTEEPGRLQSMGSLRVGYDWATWLHFSLLCIGEGNGNPLQCSCLENPRDGGAWWAVVYGVAQSRTRLKRLSSSNSKHTEINCLSRCPIKEWYLYLSDFPKVLFDFHLSNTYLLIPVLPLFLPSSLSLHVFLPILLPFSTFIIWNRLKMLMLYVYIYLVTSYYWLDNCLAIIWNKLCHS